MMIDYNKYEEYSHHGLIPAQRQFEPGDKIFSHRNDCGFAYVLAHDTDRNELFVQPSRIEQIDRTQEMTIPAHTASKPLPGEFPDYGHVPEIELVEETEIEEFFENDMDDGTDESEGVA